MPFNLQATDLLIILIVALILFGPSRLPDIGRAFGKTIKEFQSATREITQGFNQETKPGGTLPTEIKTPCKSCGKAMPAGAKFCPECGAAQSTSA